MVPRSLSVSATILILTLAVCGAKFSSPAAAADSFQQKLEHVQVNAQRTDPDPKPTSFSQEEINAYFSERRLPKMPEGVESVRFELAPDSVTAYTTVDFDELRRERKSNNPLLALFTGLHDTVVVAHTQPTSPGHVRVTVESVEIDGISVPKMALELFIDKWVKPKYPNVGLDNEYTLPARISSAQIKPQRGVIVQK
jgi:hypothetical protein